MTSSHIDFLVTLFCGPSETSIRGAAPKVPCGSRATDIALRAPSRSPPGGLRTASAVRAGALII